MCCCLQVAFLASALGPRVAAACAHESLASLSKDSGNEGISNGGITNSLKKGIHSFITVFLIS